MVDSKSCLAICSKSFWALSTFAVVPVAGNLLVILEEDSIAVVLGQGVKSDVDTVLSRPSGKRMCAKLGLASSKSTSSTKGSSLFQTNLRNKTGPFCSSCSGLLSYDSSR